jgi:primosomal protein N' (replication factor Y)
VPDEPGLDREFDYLAEAPLRVGTIVRIALSGRRLRAWAVGVDVAPAVDRERLRPILGVVGAGPPPDVVELTSWAAGRWAGPRVAFLRAASPDRVVRDPGPAGPPAAVGRGAELAVHVHRIPPAVDRRRLVQELVAPSGSTILVVADRSRVARFPGLVLGTPQAWARARRGGQVVVGGRNAAWAPVPDLGAGIVLDDLDEALKNERAPTWHARDVLAERCARAGVPLHVVSAVPSQEALAGLTAGGARPVHLHLPGRADERAGWPVTEVADRRDEPPGLGLISPLLVERLRAHVDAGRRVLCVLNRKGRARLLACGQCRALARCHVCGTAVADDGDGLVCGVCAARRPRVCAECGSTRLRLLRPGVGRLAEELGALAPRARVAELTGDTPPAAAPDAEVVVGTEAVLHRAPRGVGLVAFLDLDEELLAPRFRAAEQALWLVARAARLLGPRSGPGRLLLQTRLPDHPVVAAVGRGDPGVAAEAEATRRAAIRFPPVTALAEVAGARDDVAAFTAALAGVDVLGPTAAGRDRSRALVRAPDHEVLAAALAAARHAVDRTPRIDVDPLRV